MSDKKEEPLMESMDYPDFIKKFVKKKLAQLDLEAVDELSLFIAEDVEDYMLSVGKTLNDLDQAEIFHIEKLISDRVEEARDILPTRGS